MIERVGQDFVLPLSGVAAAGSGDRTRTLQQEPRL